jgi:hypothetical protein
MLGLFLLAGVAAFFLPDRADAANCDAIVGKWGWFIGGEVTVNSDGTFTQQSGNAGTWECTDAARGRFTMRWRDGGFVNSLALSPDGQGLTSTDQSQAYVTARRLSPVSGPQAFRKANSCQDEYREETDRIETEFTQKMATCHYPGNSGCIQEATSKKASQLKAANEKLRSCNRSVGQDAAPPEPEPPGPFDLTAEERVNYSNPIEDISRDEARQFILQQKANDWDPFFQAVFNAIDQSWQRVSRGLPDFYPVGIKYNITLNPAYRPPLSITDIQVSSNAYSEAIMRALNNASLSHIIPPSYNIAGRKISFARSTFSRSKGISRPDQAHFIEVDGVIRRYTGTKIPGARLPRNF